MFILFIDDDDSTNIDDAHVSNVESNVIIGDDADEDEDYEHRGFHLKLHICCFKDII